MTETEAMRGPLPASNDTEHHISQRIREMADSLLATTPDATHTFRKWASWITRTQGRDFLRKGRNSRFLLGQIPQAIEQLARAQAALECSLNTLREEESRLAGIPHAGMLRFSGLVVVGLLMPTVASIAIGLLLLGPTTRFLTLPLLADAVQQTIGLLTMLADGLGLQLESDPAALDLLRPRIIFALGGSLTLALSTAVVLLPDAACLFGRGRGTASVGLMILAKLAFAASFFVVRTSDLANVKLPVVAGSVFELSVMLASTWTALLVGHHLDDIRGWNRERHATTESIRALGVWQSRLKQRLAEVEEEVVNCGGEYLQFGMLDESALLSSMEDHGKVVAELSLLETLAANERNLQTALARAEFGKLPRPWNENISETIN